MKTTKERIEIDLKLRNPTLDIIYDSAMAVPYSNYDPKEYPDGATVCIIISYEDKILTWNDYYVAKNIDLNKEIDLVKGRILQQKKLERIY